MRKLAIIYITATMLAQHIASIMDNPATVVPLLIWLFKRH